MFLEIELEIDYEPENHLKATLVKYKDGQIKKIRMPDKFITLYHDELVEQYIKDLQE